MSLTYNDILDGFEGSDDDVSDIDDDEITDPNEDKIITIDDLVDREESDEDSDQPEEDDFCEAFVGFGIRFGGPGSGRYPAGSGGNEAPTNEQIHAKREAMKLPDTREGYKTAKAALTGGSSASATPATPATHDVESKIRGAYNALKIETGRSHVPIADVQQRSGLPLQDIHKWVTDPKNGVNLNEMDAWNNKAWASVNHMGRNRGFMEIFR